MFPADHDAARKEIDGTARKGSVERKSFYVQNFEQCSSCLKREIGRGMSAYQFMGCGQWFG